MSSSGSTDCSDLIQAARSGREVQRLVDDLTRHFRAEDVVEKDGYSKVDCDPKLLDDIREEFKREFVRSKQLTDIVKAIVPRPQKKYYLSYVVRLLAFQRGESTLADLGANGDDCIILIPVNIIGSAKGTLEIGQGATVRKTTFECDVGSVLVMSGRCTIQMQPQSKVVCVVLTIGRDKE